MDRYLQSLSAAVCGVCGFLWGQPDGLLYALIAFMVLDYLTGIAAAWLRCELSSGVGFLGITKKVYIMALVAVGHILDVHVLGGGSVCRSAVMGFYIANEGLSILENAGSIGLPLPKMLTKALAQLKNKEDEK